MELCTYSPQISPGNSNITPMPETMPLTLVSRETVLLEYPYASPTTTLELKVPQLNDIKLVDFSRIQRRSRGNTLITARKSYWPKSNTFNIAFNFLTASERDDVIAFVKLTLGKEVKYTDHESQEHKVILINPANPLTQEGEGCQFTWKVDLQEIIT